jgi:hypothetical protein
LRGRKGCWPFLVYTGQRRTSDLLFGISGEKIALEHLVLAGQDIPALDADGGLQLRSLIVIGGCNLTHAPKADVENCLFTYGAGLAGSPSLRNCVSLYNFGWTGGATGVAKLQNVFTKGFSAAGKYESCEVRGCTVLGRLFFEDGPNTVVDSIVDYVECRTAESHIDNCDVFNPKPYWDLARAGRRCFNANPQFRDPESIDYRLKLISLCRRRASDGGDLGCRYTPEMAELIERALEMRKKSLVKF